MEVAAQLRMCCGSPSDFACAVVAAARITQGLSPVAGRSCLRTQRRRMEENEDVLTAVVNHQEDVGISVEDILLTR